MHAYIKIHALKFIQHSKTLIWSALLSQDHITIIYGIQGELNYFLIINFTF